MRIAGLGTCRAHVLALIALAAAAGLAGCASRTPLPPAAPAPAVAPAAAPAPAAAAAPASPAPAPVAAAPAISAAAPAVAPAAPVPAASVVPPMPSVASILASMYVTPNSNLMAQGVPPIPHALVDRVQRYTDFRGHTFVEWHPTKREMLVAYRKAGASVPQIYRLASPLGTLEPLTDGTDPVTEASYEPRTGRYIVFERSTGGNEAAQIYRLDLQTRQATLLTNPDERHSIAGWLRSTGELIYSSVPLDRTAQGGTRAEVSATYWLMDPEKPKDRRKIAELPGAGWFGGAVSRDDRVLAVTRYLSATESQVWLVEVATGLHSQLLPLPNSEVKGTHLVGAFRPDGKGLLFLSDRDGEFRELMQLNFGTARIQRIVNNVPWDAESTAASEDNKMIAVQHNVDGSDEMRIIDATSLVELARLPLAPGNIAKPSFHRTNHELAYTLTTAQAPAQIYTMDANGRTEQWTRAEAPGSIDMSTFGAQRIVRWNSFDKRQISGLLNMPPAQRFPGKRPVIIDIHGGPEAQAQAGFLGRNNYLVQELGIAIIRPNVRGSSGFGKSYLMLDNGDKREDAVKDIGALLDWIATQPDLDASRVLVMGGSYGGYMSLAVAAAYAERIAGAIDDVGISHFVTFLNNTESYRRDLRRVEYGDERIPEMKAFLDRISPLTNAQKITKPLFVVQGKNDPRVPYTEAEQIVAKARANGTPVWYLRAENEGHGFVRKENADYRFYAVVKFIETVLLK